MSTQLTAQAILQLPEDLRFRFSKEDGGVLTEFTAEAVGLFAESIGMGWRLTSACFEGPRTRPDGDGSAIARRGSLDPLFREGDDEAIPANAAALVAAWLESLPNVKAEPRAPIDLDAIKARSDAGFLQRAHEDIPALIAEVERLEDLLSEGGE